ncbi:alpha-L-fucosidase [Segetibacter sp. 3557_3]|uniref:alpha-L-fucosidase n=1 Tax=Segetibacter sp. 3557_3 TaxID=2547429 RepID=UPI001058C10F|nr:alpha-L-fucosidase [Segetibacter sp. 3557_3]TDH27462.1 alpha-L-fucosidase [Segetibacter sp. 3557_3]
MYKVCLTISLVVLLLQQSTAQETYDSSWAGLQNPVPSWFPAAKFGIYVHWGPYTVPAYNSEWYSRSMYVPGTESYRHQLATYGSQKTFGYKDFVNQFRGKAFNAKDWVALFSRAGARFIGCTAEHADGYSMWNSKVNPWNAKRLGPGDVIGELSKSAHKKDLPFMATFHHQWQWGWYPTFDSTVDAGNPQYASLYGPVVSVAAWEHKPLADRPDKAFCEQWTAKVLEVTGKYKPDLLYFDSRLNHIPEQYRKQIVKDYMRRGPKHQLILYKSAELPEHVGLRTYEKTRPDSSMPETWLTEEPISTYSWSYTPDMQLRSAQNILQVLVDAVSKNGVYLLNVSPDADGAIPEAQQQVLEAIGNWLHLNGEAIYDTRPWVVFGEGPGIEKNRPLLKDRRKYFEVGYTADDIRYTSKGNFVYATFLSTPEAGQSKSLTAFNQSLFPQTMRVADVTVLATGKKVDWKWLAGLLTINMPPNDSDNLPYTLKIRMDQLIKEPSIKNNQIGSDRTTNRNR